MKIENGKKEGEINKNVLLCNIKHMKSSSPHTHSYERCKKNSLNGIKNSFYIIFFIFFLFVHWLVTFEFCLFETFFLDLLTEVLLSCNCHNIFSLDILFFFFSLGEILFLSFPCTLLESWMAA